MAMFKIMHIFTITIVFNHALLYRLNMNRSSLSKHSLYTRNDNQTLRLHSVARFYTHVCVYTRVAKSLNPLYFIEMKKYLQKYILHHSKYEMLHILYSCDCIETNYTFKSQFLRA